MLKAILASTLLADVRNISILSTPPVAPPGTCPFAYVASLKEFFEHQAQLQRKYHPREQALMYLQALQPEPKYTAAAMQLIQDLEQHKSDILPDKYTFNIRRCVLFSFISKFSCIIQVANERSILNKFV
jgi:hypothetical protein